MTESTPNGQHLTTTNTNTHDAITHALMQVKMCVQSVFIPGPRASPLSSSSAFLSHVVTSRWRRVSPHHQTMKVASRSAAPGPSRGDWITPGVTSLHQDGIKLDLVELASSCPPFAGCASFRFMEPILRSWRAVVAFSDSEGGSLFVMCNLALAHTGPRYRRHSREGW